MRLRSLPTVPLALLVACASPRSGPPSELATPNLEAAPLPQLAAPELPPVLPPPAPTSVGAFELVLPIAEEIAAAELGILEHLEGRSTLTFELARCRFTAAEPDAQDVPEDDCRSWNAETVHERSQRAIVVHPGAYEFVVQNRAYDRALGFWLRREDEPTLPIVAGGGAEAEGEARWNVELEPGRYVYSCPLSPTPDYVLIVR